MINHLINLIKQDKSKRIISLYNEMYHFEWIANKFQYEINYQGIWISTGVVVVIGTSKFVKYVIIRDKLYY